MLAEIITIGDELLIGQTIDTNSAWIGEQLSLIGISVRQVSTITDDAAHIIATLDDAKRRASIVIITGGLGPTKDDLTKQTLCDYFQTSLVLNEEVLENLKVTYKKHNIPLDQTNQAQALLPENALILPNHQGTASGMWFEQDDTVFISLPGVPYEMKGILTQEGFPRLKAHFSTPTVIHRTVRTMGIVESQIAILLEEWESSLAEHHLKLAYLPSPGAVRLRISGSDTSSAEVETLIEKKVQQLPSLIGEYIYGYDKETIETVVGTLLTQHGKTLSTAESCTGGAISRLLTKLSGSSSYYKGSIISYANDVKINQLKINADCIKKHGAVSQQVAEAMAKNVREILQTDFSIAVSGIAGPTGGSKEKPVGTVWVAVASADTVASVMLALPYEHRERNIVVSANAALQFLRTRFLVKL